ncbi:MAG TPA: hypothetical protein VFQ54_03875, partial [Thermomicrobiales bacterium]|nr:hypothetical protein [Thermomicrobiales bacterium]
FQRIAGIAHDPFASYFGTLDVGTGIEIGDIFVAPEELPLNEYLGLARPPQSFQYVDVERAVSLLNLMRRVSGTGHHHVTYSSRQLALAAEAE